MKQIENVKMFMVDVNWIAKNVKLIKENRCHCLDEKELETNLFTKFDYDKFKNRIKFYNEKIFKVKPVWKICCAMIIYLVNGKYYLVDGQGRFFSVMAYNINNDDKITEIPVIIYYDKTYQEMIEDMIAMNCFGKNWSTSDLFRYHCFTQKDSSYYKNVCKIQNELNVAEYTAKLILFGYNSASHRDSNVEKIKYSNYKDFIYECFKKFYEGTIIACNNDKIQIKTIKKQDCAQALYKIISNIIRVCEENNVSYEKKVYRCIDVLINFVNSLDRQYAFKQTFGGKQSAIASYFAKCITKKVKDEYVTLAMRKAA